ncbi:MAG: ABC transporter permease [Stomatobaculum sp.]|nr:ABC transporter permease [Stomatobaculum sp.]
MQNKEPLFRMVKRGQISFAMIAAIHMAALLMALVVCALVIVLVTGVNPLSVYAAVYEGAMGNARRFWVTVRETVILMLIAVGLTPAFRMRFWNIGAEGQILMGGMTSAALMIYCGDKLPGFVLIAAMLVCSILAGMIWGLVPAWFKAKYNTNETLFTLMMNYVAMQLVTFAICFWENPKGSNTIGTINQKTHYGWFPSIGAEKFAGRQYLFSCFIVALVTVLVFFYLRRSKQGFEIAVVGSSQNTARYAGINVKTVILRTMAISGAICGLAGAVIVGGSSHTLSTSTANGRGFTAIIVAWMSNFNPLFMLLISMLLIFMQQGSIQIASQYKLNESFSDIIIGIILFFLIGCEFFVRYKLEFRKKEAL